MGRPDTLYSKGGNISNQSSIDISQTKEVFSINLSPNSPPGVIILNLITLSFVEN